MRKPLLLAALLTIATPTAATPPMPNPEAMPSDAARDVDSARLRATVEKLVSFGTRHTLSSQTHPSRGIGAALNWTEAEFRRYSAACGGCLTVARASGTFTGDRIPKPTPVTSRTAGAPRGRNLGSIHAAPHDRTASDRGRTDLPDR